MATLFQKVLLLEDDESHRLLIRRALAGLAEQVVDAPTFADAKACLAKGSFDLIVADLNLPDAPGLGHISYLVQEAAPAPVVVLTSSNAVQDAVRAMREGAKDFIVKNFDFQFNEFFGLALSRVFSIAGLARERERFEKEMTALRSAIEKGSDAMAVIGPVGPPSYHNSAYQNFVALTGGSLASAEEALGSKLKKANLLRTTLLQQFSSLLPGASWSSELTTTSGEVFRLTLTHLVDRKDEFVLWAKDITEIARREILIRQLLNSTTHDLKGPLGAISLTVELLEDELKKDATASQIAGGKIGQMVMRIGSSARGSLEMIEEFLSARKLQEGKVTLKPTVQEVAGLIGELANSFESIARAKKIVLNVEPIAPHLTLTVDRISLIRALSNLVSNAIKYSPLGSTVTVRASGESEQVVFSIRDQGGGIDASELSSLFNRFSRLAKHNELPGSGLGLFVVKVLVEAHGGSVSVTSSPGKGSEFFITLPASPPTNERGEIVVDGFSEGMAN